MGDKEYIIKATKDRYWLNGASAKDTLMLGINLLKFTASKIGAKCTLTTEGKIFRIEINANEIIKKEEQDEQPKM